jgi:molybdate transport system substrate-binding protein
MTQRLIAALVSGLLAATAAPADAAEIKALISTAMKAPFQEMTAQFEKATSHKVVAAYGPTGGLAKRIADGEAADLVILGGSQTPELVKQGKLTAGSTTDVARGMIGAGVAKGAAKPDISSEAAFKAALLSAKSIAVTDPASGGQSGVYFAKLFEQMGLAAALKPKLKLAAGGPEGYAGTIVAKGEAEFALQPIPELMAVPGIEIVGPLPGAFQNVTTYRAGIPANAKEAEAAKALIKFLTAPPAAEIYKAKGLEPG